VQLDRVPPRAGADSGTIHPGTGVAPAGGFSIRIRAARAFAGRGSVLTWTLRDDGDGVLVAEPVRRGGANRVVLLLLFALSLVGQGERFQVDPRFRTPSETLRTYWGALGRQDLTVVNDCLADPGSLRPFPGMLWFLPPVDEIDLVSMRLVGAEAGRLIAVYEVRFRPQGTRDTHSFVTTTELCRIGQEWHVVPAEDEDLPEWQPYPRPVDI
jgi:hypothetical protein